MILSVEHRLSLLTLYRNLLRHLTYLPGNLKNDTLIIIRKEFKKHRNTPGLGIKKNILEAYHFEKLLFNYHTGLQDISSVEEVVLKYHQIYEKSKTTIRIRRKPSLVEAIPRLDIKQFVELQNEQRLERLTDKLVKSDQAKSKIPHKSKLDPQYIRQIYGTRVIHMKASQLFTKMIRLFGPNSKPYDLKYIYNGGDRLTLLALKVPMGSFKKLDKELYIHSLNHLKHREEIDTLAEYKGTYGKWLRLEDEWERNVELQNSKAGYYKSIIDCEVVIKKKNNLRLNSEVKLYNRKVMLLKSKLKPVFEKYHQLKQQNLSQMLEFISQNYINEFNDYSSSLSFILNKFGFKSKLKFNFTEFDNKLDPKEFNWEPPIKK